MNPKECGGTVIRGLCPGGSNNRCCIGKFTTTTVIPSDKYANPSKETQKSIIKGCIYENKIGTCIDNNKCDKSLNIIASNQCIGLEENIKCCIPKNQCVDYDVYGRPIIGTCTSESECKTGYFNSNSSTECSGTNVCCLKKDPRRGRIVTAGKIFLKYATDENIFYFYLINLIFLMIIIIIFSFYLLNNILFY